MQNITIGLFGFGVVGEGIYQVLSQKPQLNTRVKKIVIKDPTKQRNAPKELFSTNADDILNDGEIDVVVELIDDAEAAFTIVKTAMNKGKSVVSANKKMIAENHLELLELQRKNKVSFLYEAAVCGSIPILRNLEEYYDNDLLNYVKGIVNGSTNYILSKMKSENQSYGTALQAAQRNGFAESNPKLDVDGTDATYKLSIIALHAFGRAIAPKDILKKGIASLNKSDFTYAAEKGLVIKLVASCKLHASTIEPTVIPTFIEKEKTLSSVHNEYNGVLIGSALADEQFLYGKGAGRFPTSSAVLSDISALRYDYKYELRKGIKNGFYGDFYTNRKIYLGFKPGEKVDLDLFDEVDEHYRSKDYQYVTGSIHLNKLKNSGWLEKDRLSVISF